MSRWFRFYDDALNDPKILRLPDNLYRAWTGILCVASKNNGTLPCVDDVAIMLRITVSQAKIILSSLTDVGLLDRFRNGTLSPHNWRKRQYKSDVSTTRVQQFRERQRNVSETPPDTEQITDTDDDDTKGKTSSISEEAFEIAKEITLLVGHDPAFVPPAWHGAPYKIQSWLSGGWPRDAILTSAKIQMEARGTRKAPTTVQYFEKGIADFIESQSQPLPTGEHNGSLTVMADRKTVTAKRETTLSLPGWAASRIGWLGTVKLDGREIYYLTSGLPKLGHQERTQLENQLSDLESLLCPVDGDDENKLVLVTKMILALASAQVSERGAEARGEAYQFALSDVPAWAVDGAIKNWYIGKVKNIAESEFKWCPSPAVLLRASKDVLWPYEEAAVKIRRLLEAKPLNEIL